MRISPVQAKAGTTLARMRAAEFPVQVEVAEGIVAQTSGATGGCAIENVLFPPFRPGTTHVVILRPIDLPRPIPGRTKKRHDGADDFAQEANQNGCDRYHVTSPAMR